MNVHVESNFVGAWFLLSTRLAVYRVCNVQFCNGSYRHKLVDLVQRMNDLFERPCLIIELNREQQQRNFLETRDHRTKYVDMIMYFRDLLFKKSRLIILGFARVTICVTQRIFYARI